MVILLGTMITAVNCEPDLNETPCDVAENVTLELVPDTYQIGASITLKNNTVLNLNNSILNCSATCFVTTANNFTYKNGILNGTAYFTNGAFSYLNIENIIFNGTAVIPIQFSGDTHIKIIDSIFDGSWTQSFAITSSYNFTFNNNIVYAKASGNVGIRNNDIDEQLWINNTIYDAINIGGENVNYSLYNNTFSGAIDLGSSGSVEIENVTNLIMENNIFQGELTLVEMTHSMITNISDNNWSTTKTHYVIADNQVNITGNVFNGSTCEDLDFNDICDDVLLVGNNTKEVYDTLAQVYFNDWNGSCLSNLPQIPCNVTGYLELEPDTYNVSGDAIEFLNNSHLNLNGSTITGTAILFKMYENTGWVADNMTLSNGHISQVAGSNSIYLLSNEALINNVTASISGILRWIYSATHSMENVTIINNEINATTLSGSLIYANYYEQEFILKNNTFHSDGQIHMYSIQNGTTYNISNNVLDVDFINLINNNSRTEFISNNISLNESTYSISMQKYTTGVEHDVYIYDNRFLNYTTQALKLNNFMQSELNITNNYFYANTSPLWIADANSTLNVTYNYYNDTSCNDFDEDDICDAMLLVGNVSFEVWDLFASVSSYNLDTTVPDLLNWTISSTSITSGSTITFSIIVRDNTTAVSTPTIAILDADGITTTYATGLTVGTNTNLSNMTWQKSISPSTVGTWTWVATNLTDTFNNTYNESIGQNFTVTTADDGGGGGGGGGTTTTEDLTDIIQLIREINFTSVVETTELFSVKTDVGSKRYVLLGFREKNNTQILHIYNKFDESRDITLFCDEASGNVCDSVTFTNSSFTMFPSSLPRVETFTFNGSESTSFKIIGVTGENEQSSITVDYRFLKLSTIIYIIVPVIILLGSVFVIFLLNRFK